MPLQHAPTPNAAMELRNIRTFLGWTQAELAHALGVSAGVISYWEHGTKPVPWPILKLSRYLALWSRPRSAFVGVDAPQQRIAVAPGLSCSWRGPEPCGGRCLEFSYQVSRRRHLVGSACEAHLDQLYDILRTHIAEKERREVLRQRGTARKRLARRQAREGVAASPAS
jgi:transcriptional regulator with XRE-family HTH domain